MLLARRAALIGVGLGVAACGGRARPARRPRSRRRAFSPNPCRRPARFRRCRRSGARSAAGWCTRARRRAPDPRLELPVRHRGQRRRPGDRQRQAGPGMAQRRVAGLRGAAARQRHADPDRSANRGRTRRCSTTRSAASCPTPAASRSARPGSTPSRSRPPAGCGSGPGEYVTLGARAAEGAQVRLRLPDGTVVPLDPPAGRPRGARRACAPSTGTPRGSQTPVVRDRFVGLLRGRAVGPDPGPILPAARSSLAAARHRLGRRRGDRRRRYRARPLAAADGDARQPAAGRGAGGRHDAGIGARQHDRRAGAPRAAPTPGSFPSGTRAAVDRPAER